MRPDYAEILHRAGFSLIARLDYRLSVTAWWNESPSMLMQVLIVPVGDAVILKASKAYCMVAAAQAGHTWSRDIPALHDWLESHLPEVRVAFSHFRDVPPALAATAAAGGRAGPATAMPTPQRLIELQRQLNKRQTAAAADARMTGLLGDEGDALGAYLHHRRHRDEAATRTLENEIAHVRERLDAVNHLQREYQRKGSAATYTFTTHSNVQVACDTAEFTAALRAVTHEIQDQHRYQITQKLQGGRLHIQIAEADEPAITWIEQWLGGTLSPTQLARIETSGHPVPIRNEHVMVVPDEPIECADGHVQADAKHLGAQVLSTIVNLLDTTETESQRQTIASERDSESMPLRIGVLVDDSGRQLGPADLPLNQIVHGIVSGTTGSGKSYLMRVLIEEAAQVADLAVLVLDPRRQFSGLLVPEDRPSVLSRYEEFSMDVRHARGFAFAYHAPAMPEARLPSDPASLASGRAIVSLSGLGEADRCDRAATVLTAAFDALASRGESDRPRLLITIDEAHLFTRRRMVDKDAIAAAARCEAAIDRLVREGRKHGIVACFGTQSARDFTRELASVRQMTSSKFFLRNADSAIEDAAGVLDDPRVLLNLPTGVALAHNAAWGVRRIRVRPPYSKVRELDDVLIRSLIGQPAVRAANAMSSEARDLLDMLRTTCATAGPLNMSQIAALSGITSKRRLLALVNELESARLVSARRQPERGSPRLVMPSSLIEPPAAARERSQGL